MQDEIDLANEDEDAEEKRERLMNYLTKLNQMKRRLYKMMANSSSMNTALQEIKSYSAPPPLVLRVIVALLIVVGIPNFEVYLGDDLLEWPEDTLKLWKFTRANMQLSQRHPQNIFRMLSKATKGQAHADVKRKMVCIVAAEKIMEGADREAVHHASSVAASLLDWIQVGIKQAYAEIELADLDCEMEEETQSYGNGNGNNDYE
eukprot:gene9661-11451_t